MSGHDLTLLSLGAALGAYLLLLSQIVLAVRDDSRARTARIAKGE